MKMPPTLAVTVSAALCLLMTPTPSTAADAPALWDKHCASCHAKDGSGSTRMGKKEGVRDYRDAAIQASVKDEAGMKSIKDGMIEKGKERMKPFKDKLSDDEIKALMAHLRTLQR